MAFEDRLSSHDGEMRGTFRLARWQLVEAGMPIESCSAKCRSDSTSK
jgi:hypothetical protein